MAYPSRMRKKTANYLSMTVTIEEYRWAGGIEAA
jgi:hypothetical protein